MPGSNRLANEHFIENLTWPEVGRAIDAGVTAVLLPIGSTEQHGRHMPLNTDAFIARGLCSGAADLADSDGLKLLIAPTISQTLSWYHMQFPGTVSVSLDTFLHVFQEVCDSLTHHGFKNLIAVNGHGGNSAALTVAINRYFETTGTRVFVVQWWDIASDALAEVEGPMLHAEEAETSVALALGQRVLMEEAARDAFDRGQAVKSAGLPWTSFGRYGLSHRGPGVLVPMDMLRDISPSGVVGDATRARRETGDRILSQALPRIIQVAREMAGRSA